jgi:4-hydroxy-4-methyl-2-oxoglutarate aldolase
MLLMLRINKDVERVDEELVAAYRKLSVSTLGHFTDMLFIRSLRPNRDRVKLVGPALTVKIPHLDSTAVHVALDYVKPGDVVVVSMSGDTERACWGGFVTYGAVKKNVAGAIIDGRICDIREIDSLNFPIFSRGASPMTTRIMGLEGEIGGSIAIDQVSINAGDLIFADEDGIAVLNKENALSYRAIIEEAESSEIAEKARMDRGESPAAISGADRYVTRT